MTALSADENWIHGRERQADPNQLNFVDQFAAAPSHQRPQLTDDARHG
jgi:hypothetical protein